MSALEQDAPLSYEPDFDIRKSLLELAPEAWEDAEADDELRPLALRVANKPARRLAPPELLALLEHRLCLPQALPLAVARLSADPFAEARDYPGDLLTAVLESDSRYWAENAALWGDVLEIVARVLETVRARMEAEDTPEYMPWFVGDEFIAAVLHFRGIHQGGAEA